MQWFDSTKRRTVLPDSELRFISTHANAVSSGPRWAYKSNTKHIAGSSNFTLCGKELARAFPADAPGYTLCAKCRQIRANQ